MALVNYGKDYGKLVVIVDVIDQNRVCSSVLFILGCLFLSILFNFFGDSLYLDSTFCILHFDLTFYADIT